MHIYLEKPQPQGSLRHPTDLYRARFRQGKTVRSDSVDRLEVLVDSSSDERWPVPLPNGDLVYHSERGAAGLYTLQGHTVLRHPRIERYAVRPDGAEYAFVTDGKLYRHRPGQSQERVELPHNAPREVAYSPAGELLFTDRTGLYRAEGPELLAAGHFSEVSLALDGQSFVYVVGDSLGDQLRLRELHGQDRLLKHSASEKDMPEVPFYHQPRFSPDGSRVLYCALSEEQCDLRVIGAQGGEPTVLCDDVLGVAV